MLKLNEQINGRIIAEIKSDANKGIPISPSISKLYKRGMTITHSILIIKLAYGISLAEAKNLVANHNSWKTLVRATRPYHDKFIKNLETFLEVDKDKVHFYQERSSQVLHLEKDGEKVLEVSLVWRRDGPCCTGNTN